MIKLIRPIQIEMELSGYVERVREKEIEEFDYMVRIAADILMTAYEEGKSQCGYCFNVNGCDVRFQMTITDSHNIKVWADNPHNETFIYIEGWEE